MLIRNIITSTVEFVFYCILRHSHCQIMIHCAIIRFISRWRRAVIKCVFPLYRGIPIISPNTINPIKVSILTLSPLSLCQYLFKPCLFPLHFNILMLFLCQLLIKETLNHIFNHSCTFFQ